MSSNGWMITTTVLTNRERGRVRREEGREGGKEGERERRVGVCDNVLLFLTV